MQPKDKGKIRVLLLAANPSGTVALRLDEEARDIQEVLDRAEVSSEVRHITAVRPRDIPRKLRTFQPNFVHFCGHGEKDKGILLEDSTGRASPVSNEALGSLFSLLRGVKCLFLNNCHSSHQAEAVARYVPYVVAMSEAISDKAAIEFAFGFYQAVSDGVNIPTAFEFGKAAINLACFYTEADIPVLFRKKPKKRRQQPQPVYPVAIDTLSRDITLPQQKNKIDKDPVITCPLGPPAESDASPFPPVIWNALKLKTSYVPEHISIRSHKRSHRSIQRSASATDDAPFQVFEVLFTEILSLIQPSFSWEVTPLQGDHGIDFCGIRELFSVPELRISAHLLVCGQCKVRSGKSRPLDVFSSDLEKLLYGVRSTKREGDTKAIYPSYVILALAGVATSRSLDSAARVFMENHHIPLYLFGLREIDYLIRHHISALSPTITSCLPSEIAKEFISYFSAPSTQGSFHVEMSTISKPSRVLAGEPFTISISVSHFLLPTQHLNLRLLSSDGEPLHSLGPSSRTPVLVVSPLVITSPSGMIVGGQGSFTQIINLRLVTYSTGEIDLGLVTIEAERSQICRYPLGSVDVADTYTPPFYWQPHREYWSRFNDWFAQAAAGAGKLVACLGSGGAGKTRLCQEFCIRSEQLGGASLSIAHHNGLDQPYRILRDLLLALSPTGIDSSFQPSARVEHAIQQLSPTLYSEIRGALTTCLDATQTEHTSTFNTQDIERALVALLIARASSTVNVIHFSNLHWCHPEILRLLRSVALETNTHLKATGNACIFLFEGRAGHVQSSPRFGEQEDAEDWSTIAFEAFAGTSCDDCIRLKPLSEAESEGFLRNIVEHSQSSHRKVSLAMIPHQKELLRQVLDAARGNPQHMVEQLNLLRHKEVIARNERTGLLYLVKLPAERYGPPADILDLIESHFSYYRLHNAALARLIRATALVDDRIDQQLFDLLRTHFAPDQKLRQIEESEFLLLPDRPGGEIAFRHENYFHVINREPMLSNDQSEAVSIYIRYVDSLPRQSATLLLLRARAVLADSDRSWDEARKNLIKASSLATRAREDHVELRILEALEPLSEARASDPLRLFRLRRRIAELRMAVGDRRRSSESLKAALLELETRIHPLLTKTRQRLGRAQKALEVLLSGRVLLADAKLNLFETDESIALLELCLESLADEDSSPLSRKRRAILHAEILNRLAVAYAIAGRNAEAASTAALSVSVARETGDRSALYTCLVDYGNIVAPITIDTGLAALEEALALETLMRNQPQQFLIGRIHLLMLRLIWNLHHSADDSGERSKEYRRILSNLEKIYTEARSLGLIQEAGAAALLCGDTLILLGDSRAADWFLQAVAWSFRGNHLENLWRAHINLAQFLLEAPEKSIETALHHAEHALRLLGSLDVKTTKAQLALAQVARIFLVCGDERGPELLRAIPSLWNLRFDNLDGEEVFRSERASLDYFRIGTSVYFLY